MALTEQQLAGLLQASLDRAKEMLREAGRLQPFGTRAKPTGEIEFVDPDEVASAVSAEAMYVGIASILAHEARHDEILAAALVGNMRVEQGTDVDFQTAVLVTLEAPGFCRSVALPYRASAGGFEFGALIAEQADPILFV